MRPLRDRLVEAFDAFKADPETVGAFLAICGEALMTAQEKLEGILAKGLLQQQAETIAAIPADVLHERCIRYIAHVWQMHPDEQDPSDHLCCNIDAAADNIGTHVPGYRFRSREFARSDDHASPPG